MDEVKEAQLKLAIANAEVALAQAKSALEAYQDSPERNVFSSLEEAEDTLDEKLRGKASDDCEGSYNCGQETYEQEFIVNGAHYIGTLKCEYNRHDKTYYYLEEAEFSYVAKV